MPINSPKKDDYSELLTAISSLTLTGGGFVGMKYARSAEIVLPAGEETIILGSSTDCIREIHLINESAALVSLWWNDGGMITPVPGGLMELGSTYQDWTDGGFELRAKSGNSANLKLLVRSTKPIDYQVGIENNIEEDDEMPINLLINKGLIVQGAQMFYADSFKDGHEYTFTFSTNGIDVGNNLKVYLLPITFLSIPQMTFYGGSYSDLPWQMDTSWGYDDIELLTQARTHNISSPSPDINFNLSFYRSKFIVGFGSLMNIAGIGESDVLFKNVDYTPNIDPLLGGTFILNSIF